MCIAEAGGEQLNWENWENWEVPPPSSSPGMWEKPPRLGTPPALQQTQKWLRAGAGPGSRPGFVSPAPGLAVPPPGWPQTREFCKVFFFCPSEIRIERLLQAGVEPLKHLMEQGGVGWGAAGFGKVSPAKAAPGSVFSSAFWVLKQQKKHHKGPPGVEP